MRIAVVSAQVFPSPPKGYAGLELITYLQARGLARLGHQVTLFAPDGSKGDGFGVCHTGPGGQWGEHAAFDRTWKHILQHDVVIDSSWEKWSYTLKSEGVLKAPILGVWHAPVDTMKSLPPGVDKPCAVLISDDQRNHFEALFNRKGRTAYNGIDLDFYKPMDAERTNRALFLARFSAVKGADLAIHACIEAGVGLDLVGDTTITNEPDYLRHIVNCCDGNRIKMVGPETRGGCVRRFSTANFFLHPNQRFREPFGLAPVEAQACGLPIVCCNNGAMRETVKHGETGYIVETVQQLIDAVKMLSSTPITQHVRDRCREWASQFSDVNMAVRYQELCNEALSGGW